MQIDRSKAVELKDIPDITEEEIQKASEELYKIIAKNMDTLIIESILKENKQLKEDKKELIEFLKEYDKYRDSFKWNEQDYIDTIEKIKEILGDKENE